METSARHCPMAAASISRFYEPGCIRSKLFRVIRPFSDRHSGYRRFHRSALPEGTHVNQFAVCESVDLRTRLTRQRLRFVMLPPQGQSGFLDLVRDPRQPVHALIQSLFRLSFRNGRLRMVLTSAHGTRLAFPELGGQRKGQRMKLSVPKRSAHRLAYLDCGCCDPIGKRRCFGCVTLQAVSLHGELYVVPLQLLLLLLHGTQSKLELL